MEHRQVRVVEDVRQWNNATRRYTITERVRIFKLPIASFRLTADGTTGNNIPKARLLLFLVMAGPGKWFTKPELRQRLPMLKRSYLNRLTYLARWKYINQRIRLCKTGRTRQFEYSVGATAENLLRHLPAQLFNEFAAEIIQRNQDLFSYLTPQSQPQPTATPIRLSNRDNRGDIKVSHDLAEKYRHLSQRMPLEFIAEDPEITIETIDLKALGYTCIFIRNGCQCDYYTFDKQQWSSYYPSGGINGGWPERGIEVKSRYQAEDLLGCIDFQKDSLKIDKLDADRFGIKEERT